MNTLFARLQEPSSCVAIGGMLALFGLEVAPEIWDKLVGHIIEMLGGAAFIAGLVMRERGER